MFDLNIYKDKLISDIGIKRFNHCLRVKDFALKLNHNIDAYKVKTAAILHDCAKYREAYYLGKYEDKCDFSDEILSNKAVIHSFLGKIVAKEEYNIYDEDILNAIKYHTTGRENMTELEKVIYLADACEKERNYDGVEEIRKLAFVDLDKAILKSLDLTIKSLVDRKNIIFLLTIRARNFLLKEKNG